MKVIQKCVHNLALGIAVYYWNCHSLFIMKPFNVMDVWFPSEISCNVSVPIWLSSEFYFSSRFSISCLFIISDSLSDSSPHFFWTDCALSLCLIDPETLLSRFKYSVCKDEIFKHIWSGYFYSLLNSTWWLANWAEYFLLWWKLSRNVCIIWYSE